MRGGTGIRDGREELVELGEEFISVRALINRFRSFDTVDLNGAELLSVSIMA
jgi:hypothetical protein